MSTQTRKSVSTIKQHFNPRLLILDDSVNLVLATQGIDTFALEDYHIARDIMDIPRITVHQMLTTVSDVVLEDLLQSTQSANFCNGITAEYVTHSFRTSDMILYVKNQQHPYDITGFATLSIRGDDLYVDLICTNQMYAGMGRYFFDRLFPKLQNVLGLRKITLCSTPDAYAFYKHMGLEEEEDRGYCDRRLRKMRTRRATKATKARPTKIL